jgi:hypothetical protein
LFICAMVGAARAAGRTVAVDSLHPRDVVAASLAASSAAIRKWTESGGQEDLPKLMAQAFDALRVEFAATPYLEA